MTELRMEMTSMEVDQFHPEQERRFSSCPSETGPYPTNMGAQNLIVVNFFFSRSLVIMEYIRIKLETRMARPEKLFPALALNPQRHL